MVMRRQVVLLAVAGLQAVACGKAVAPGGATSSTSGSIASVSSASTASSSATASSGSSGSHSSSTSSGSVSSSTASSGSTASSSSSSGSSGSTAGMVSGSLTYNTQALTHPGYVGLFTTNPALPGAQAVAFEATDDTGAYQLGPVDAGTYWFAASYGPGLFDAGELSYPDGGLTPGAVAAELIQEPLQVDGPVSPVDLDLSEISAGLASITLNIADAPDAGIPVAGRISLDDGGALYPLLILGLVGGTNPIDGTPISDATGATFGTSAGPTYTMAFHTGVSTDADYEKYSYEVPFSQPASWQAATAGTYLFTVTGSTALGATETRQIDVDPFTDVPVIDSPADQSNQSGNILGGVVVAWNDAPRASGTQLDVKDQADGSTLCTLPYPQTTPVNLSFNNGCSFSLGHTYVIEVLSIRFSAQAQGVSYEEAYARVRVSF